MTVDEYEAAMRRKLIEAGFDFDVPNPALAWAVFKSFAAQPVECQDSYLFGKPRMTTSTSCESFANTRKAVPYGTNK